MSFDDIENLDEEFEAIRKSNKDFDYSIDLCDDKIKEYKAYVSISSDLITVRDSISILLENLEIEYSQKNNEKKIQLLIERSLFVATIITYCRCFNSGYGRGIRLKKEWLENSENQLKEMHEKLILIRNKYLAHADISNSERIYITANFLIKSNDEISISLNYEVFEQFNLNKRVLSQFLELVNCLLNLVSIKIDESAIHYLNTLTSEEKENLLKKAIKKKNAR